MKLSSIGTVVSEENMFENVDGPRTDDGWTTNAGVIGILIAHLRAFGSGELKMHAQQSYENSNFESSKS